MIDIPRLRQALKDIFDHNEADRWVLGLIGKGTADAPVFEVPGRPNFIFVRLRNAAGSQTTAPARNDAGVAWSYNLPVRMRYEGKTLVVDCVVRREDLATVPPPDPSGVPIHIHDGRYFTEAEHITVSAGAGDAGKPAVTDAGGQWDISLLNGAVIAEMARDALGSALVEGAGIDITVNDAGDTITIAGTITQYTDEMARDALGTALTAGTGITITVNDAGDTITIATTITQYTDEMARDALGTALTQGAGITITVDDAGNTITIASSITQYTDELAQDAVGAMVTGNTETGIAVTYDDAGAKLNFVVDAEFISDTVGAMVTGNTETDIAVTYDDADNTLDFVVSATLVGDRIHAASSKTTPVDADELGIADSAASFVLKKLTWANLKATLKTYFDTLYNLYVHPNHTGDVTSVADGATTIANDVVTNAKLANMAANTIKGRITALTGDPEDLTAANVRTIINVADGATAYTDEMARDALGTALTQGNGIAITPSDVGDTITIALTTLTTDWNIGEDRAILAEFLKARDNEGLTITDDGGDTVMNINDAGPVDIRIAATDGMLLRLSDTFTLTEAGIPFQTGFYKAGAEDAVSLVMVRALSTNAMMNAGVTGDTFRRLLISADGTFNWGPGSATRDISMLRNATLGTLVVTSATIAELMRFASVAGSSTSVQGEVLVGFDARVNTGTTPGAAIYATEIDVSDNRHDLSLAVKLVNDTTTAPAKKIVISGTTGAVGINVAAASIAAQLHVIQDIITGNALRVVRDLASASTDAALVDFINDNAGDDQTLLRGQQDGTGDILNLFDGATEVFTILDGGNVGINIDTPLARMHIVQPTLGTSIMRLQTTASNDDLIMDYLHNKVLTTDATPTTLHTIAIPASNTVFIDVTVIAHRTGGVSGTADDGAAYKKTASYTTKAGVVTLIVNDMTDINREDVVGWNCALVISGSNVLVQVTGAATTNISWALIEAKISMIGT